ncbi:MAG TPA: glycerol-3-phosphate dehydrogenase/oxidase [Thermoplasmata archaeon]|nr:glycerol-3-phosphate dehydrogenase/oxidase [Thermoplasmata archaeon]
MNEFSVQTRAANLAVMAERPLDVLVIGGGIVGAWIAATAAVRGYRVGLVEKGDFASGTSGKTSRLIHGGLRYLQRFRIRVVRQAARERDVLLRIAPDLVRPLTFLLPVYRGRGPKGWQLRFGLWLYDALSREHALPKRVWVSREEALGREPALNPEGLVRGVLYSDAITRDARLVLRVVRAAADAGALVANYAAVTELIREEGRVRGAKVRDGEDGSVRDVRARVVINATGVWVGDLQDPARRLRLRPTKGIHLFVRRDRLGSEGAVVLPTRDRRIVFVLPWGELALIGTTDTDHRGDRERVAAAPADVEYLLAAVNEGFPRARLTAKDVVSTYAGLRPLIDTGERRESDISRAHEILVDPDGLVSVAGGKLTTGRAMAVDVLRRIASSLPPNTKAVETRALSLAGPEPDLGGDVGKAAIHAARHEMAVHVDDVLVRRLGIYYERKDHALGDVAAVVNALGDELRWNEERRRREMERLRNLVAEGEAWRGGRR